MWEPPELEVLRGKILGTEMELELIFKDLEKGEAELSYNSKIQIQLIENMTFLKKEDVIVSIQEYKKIKQQLTIITARIAHYKKKIVPIKNKAKSLEESYSKDMDKFLEFYKNRTKDNILVFKNERATAKKTPDK